MWNTKGVVIYQNMLFSFSGNKCRPRIVKFQKEESYKKAIIK